MFSWKTFNEVKTTVDDIEVCEVLNMDEYVNTTFTSISTLLTTKHKNHTVTLNSTVHLRSSNRSDIYKL